MADALVFANPYCRCRARVCHRAFCPECGVVLIAHVGSREYAERIAAEHAGAAHRCGPDPYQFGGFRTLGPLVVP